VGIGPPTPDQVSVPAKQGLGLDKEPAQTPAAKKSAHSGKQRTVRRAQRRASHLAAEHRHLVTEHDDFDCQFVSVKLQETE